LGFWGIGVGPQSPSPNPQSPIPNPQSPIPNIILLNKLILINKFDKIINNIILMIFFYFFKIYNSLILIFTILQRYN
jgi:hypothetical protein